MAQKSSDAKQTYPLGIILLAAVVAAAAAWFLKPDPKDETPTPNPGGPPGFRRARLFNAGKQAEAKVTVKGLKSNGTWGEEEVTATPTADDTSKFGHLNSSSGNKYLDLEVVVEHDDKSAKFLHTPDTPSTDAFPTLMPSANWRYVEVSVSLRKVGNVYKAHVVALKGEDNTFGADLEMVETPEKTLVAD